MQIFSLKNFSEDSGVLEGGLTLDEQSFFGSTGLSFGGDDLSVLSGLSLNLIVLLNSFDESISASGLSQVLNSHINSLGDDSVSDQFINNNST